MKLSPSQQKLFELLKERISPDIAQMFLDAVEELSKEPPSKTVVHKVTHLLREVESAVLAVVDLLAEDLIAEEQVKAVNAGTELKVNITLQRKLLDSLTGKDFTKIAKEVHGRKGSFADLAHRSGLSVRPLTAKTISRIEAWEKQLIQYLEEFGKLYSLLFQRVDKMVALEPKALVSALSTLPLNLALWERLFTQITSVSTIEELHKSGMLASPPAHQTDSLVGKWMPMILIEALLRLATNAEDDVKDSLFGIALTIPFQDNERASWKMIDFAMMVSPSKSAELAQFATSLRDALLLFPADIGGWIAFLAENGQYDIASHIFEVFYDPALYAADDDYHFSNNSYQLVKDIETSLPALVQTDPHHTVQLLAKQLKAAIDFAVKDKSEGYEDSFTFFWKEGGTIGNISHQSHGGVVELCVNTLTQAIDIAITQKGFTVENALDMLSAYSESKTFNRISYHYLKTNPHSEEYETLLSSLSSDLEYGESRPPRLMSGEVSHLTPLTLEEMEKKTLAELVAYIIASDLPDWVWKGPDKTGLLNTFEELVRQKPQYILDNCFDLKGVSDDIIYIVCRGIADSSVILDNVKLIQFYQWLFDEGYTAKDDNDVGHSLIRGIKRHFIVKKEILPTSSPAWILLSKMALQPRVMKSEIVSKSEALDAVTGHAINTPNSMAAEVLFYSLFIEGIYAQDIAKRADCIDFKAFFEALAQSESPLIAYIMGRYLHYLLWLDIDWVMESIVPALLNPSEIFKRDSAWLGYLISHRISSRLLEYYREVMLGWDTDNLDADIGQWHPAKNTAGHITFLYFEGKISLDADSLLQLFFQRAPYSARKEALNSCKQFIKDSAGEDNFTKLKVLWDYRLQAVKDEFAFDTAPAVLYELHALIAWVESSFELDEIWFCEQISELIKLTRLQEGERSHHYSSRLIDLLSRKNFKHPLKVAQTVLEWAEAGCICWNKQSLQALLRKLLECKDIEVKRNVAQIASLMCVRGETNAFIEFTD